MCVEMLIALNKLKALPLRRKLSALGGVALLAASLMLAACGGTTPIPPKPAQPTATISTGNPTPLPTVEAPGENEADAGPTIEVEELDPVRPSLPARREPLYPSSPRIQ